MTSLADRAVAVALDDSRILVMRRHRDGEDYCVLPGGGIEPGEDPGQAALRELMEETGLTGELDQPLWTIEHPDRAAQYFLVSVVPGPLRVGGPEALAQSDRNRYAPGWISLEELDAENLQPATLRARLSTLRP